MRLSPFNPIHFRGHDIKDGAMEGFVHVLSPSDHIFLQVFHKDSEAPESLELINYRTRETLMNLSWATIRFNETDCTSFYELNGLDTGEYIIKFGDLYSNLIHVADQEKELDNTVLIQFAMRNNYSRRDIYTRIKGYIRYIDFRIPGGFKDEDWSFLVDNDQFVTDKSDIVEIGSVESTEKVLTIGQSDGVPKWIGEMMNRILACDLIFIDGVRYSLSESSNLESIGQNLSGDRFIYAVNLRQARFWDAEYERKIRIGLRRTPTHYRKATPNNLRGI